MREGAVRRIAMNSPTMPPPISAPSDSNKVQGMALRRKSSSPVPKLRAIVKHPRPVFPRQRPRRTFRKKPSTSIATEGEVCTHTTHATGAPDGDAYLGRKLSSEVRYV